MSKDNRTALLFVVFNRPDETKRVFDEIRKATPPRLYIASDGPRQGFSDDYRLIAEVRRIVEEVDWPCQVRTLFRDKNIGAGSAVAGAVTWFFSHEDMGIVLEDDCLPSQSFFGFAQQLLEHYASDEDVALISGYNAQQEWKRCNSEYFFSNFGGTWGWASWKRAWSHYDSEMTKLDEIVAAGRLRRELGSKLGKLRERELLSARSQIRSGEIDAWDYQWAYSRHLIGGLACVPSVSLVENIGFGPNATHTRIPPSRIVRRKELSLPLTVNLEKQADKEYDLRFIRKRPLFLRLFSRLGFILNRQEFSSNWATSLVFRQPDTNTDAKRSL